MILYLEFNKIVRALIATKAKFAVAGGLAVGLHGHLRSTKDIDLLSRTEDLDLIRGVLKAAGYRESGNGVSFPKSGLGLRRFYRRPPQAQELLMIDILLVESPRMAKILQGAVRISYGGFKLPVVAIDDLITMKKMRGSTQDKADIEKLKPKRR